MEKYRVYFDKIEKHEVIKETPKQVIYIKKYPSETKEERESKISSWYSWHDTFEQAKSYLLEKKVRETNALLSRIKKLEEEMNAISLLTE